MRINEKQKSFTIIDHKRCAFQIHVDVDECVEYKTEKDEIPIAIHLHINCRPQSLIEEDIVFGKKQPVNSALPKI